MLCFMREKPITANHSVTSCNDRPLKIELTLYAVIGWLSVNQVYNITVCEIEGKIDTIYHAQYSRVDD